MCLEKYSDSLFLTTYHRKMSPEFVCVLAFVIIGAVICSMLYQRREGFTNWQDTVAYGKSVANPMAVTTDITRPNFAATADPAEIAAVNTRIADATRTPVMLPGPGDGSVQSNTGLGLYSAKPSYQIPQNSKALANALESRCVVKSSAIIVFFSAMSGLCQHSDGLIAVLFAIH
jgi:hypothetical protein